MSNPLNIDPVLLGDNKPGRQIQNVTLIRDQLNNRVQVLERENLKLKKDKKKIGEKYQQDKSDYEAIIELLKQETTDYKKENAQIEFRYMNEQRENDDLEEELKQSLDQKKRQYDEEKYELLERIKSLEQRLDQIHSYTEEKQQLEAESHSLKEQLLVEKKEKQRVLADQEREKVQATDKLQKDMDHKIEETKVQLLALKKEQIATTNRLTVLQNHQLTTELEYQSKQTEKLLFRNSKLMDQISQLKRDVEIHKQVEQELAKRSQTSQTQIKKLSQQIKEQEEINEKLKKERDALREPEELDLLQQKKKEEMIEKMEKQLELAEKKYQKIMNDLDILKNEQTYLQSRIDNTEPRNANQAQIIAHCLENFINNNPGIYDDVNNYKESQNEEQQLQNIRNKDIMEWNSEEKEFVIFHLLNKVRGMISKNNLMLNQNNNNEASNVNVQVIQEDEDEMENNVEGSQNQQVLGGNLMNPNNNSIKASGISNNANRYSINSNNVSDSRSKLILPRISQEQVNSFEFSNDNSIKVNGARRFKGMPIDVSSQIVKGNVRDWGKQALTMPSNNKKAMQLQRRFKMD